VRLDVPSRATNTASCISHPTVPQSYSDLSSSTHSTVHTIGCQAKRLQRPSSVSTAVTAIAGTRQTLIFFQSHFLRESRTNCRPMSNVCGDSSLFYLTQTFASSRSSAENGTDQAWRARALARVYTGIIQPTPPHAPSPHDRTQVQSAGTPLPRGSSQSQSQS